MLELAFLTYFLFSLASRCDSADPDARYVAPTVMLVSNLDTPLMQEEIFGPILPIVLIDDIDHVCRE